MILNAKKMACSFLFWLFPVFIASTGWGAIHNAPVIIPAFKIRSANFHPIKKYALYATTDSFTAKAIPFQIDEINEFGDYVMDLGPNPNTKSGNGIFDLHDELSFMGNDIGISQQPKIWPFDKPDILYEIKFSNHFNPKLRSGSVFLGIHLKSNPVITDYKYVIFDKENGNITTSRYFYEFDNNNYLMTKKVDMINHDQKTNTNIRTPIIDSSVFHLKADLKYFLTVRANHRSIFSELDAYKTGPIRTIVRVNFYYVIMKLNFKAGMYTEVSFFSNSVILPAIIDNPIDPKTTLNNGSGFYYGFAFHDNPLLSELTTNMKTYPPKANIFELFTQNPRNTNNFWLTLKDKSKMIYLNIKLSKKMLNNENYPFLYTQNTEGKLLPKFSEKNWDLKGKSPINLALYFDLTRFTKGEQLLSFQLYFENKRDDGIMKTIQNLDHWHYFIARI